MEATSNWGWWLAATPLIIFVIIGLVTAIGRFNFGATFTAIRLPNMPGSDNMTVRTIAAIVLLEVVIWFALPRFINYLGLGRFVAINSVLVVLAIMWIGCAGNVARSLTTLASVLVAACLLFAPACQRPSASWNNQAVATVERPKTDPMKHSEVVMPISPAWSEPFELAPHESFSFEGAVNYRVKDGSGKIWEFDISQSYPNDLWKNLAPAQAKFAFQVVGNQPATMVVRHGRL